MQWLAAVLAVVAMVIFMLAHFNVPRSWITIPLGLTFLTAAWMIQLIWLSGKHFTVN